MSSFLFYLLFARLGFFLVVGGGEVADGQLLNFSLYCDFKTNIHLTKKQMLFLFSLSRVFK